ncbi:MAG: HPP family protein [Burkholderiaceae bacterium]
MRSEGTMTWQALKSAARTLLPADVRLSQRERLRIAIGALFGIAIAALLGAAASPAEPVSRWLIAPMGATAVLVFAIPASPLAQPWAVIGGNTVSALIGISCARWIGDPVVAAALAVGLAILGMFAMRCLHPPGGASALLMVLTHTTTPAYALSPVLSNSLLMVFAGVLFNQLSGHRYPRAQRTKAHADQPRSRFSSEDFDAALAHYDEVLDISRDDLERLLNDAELARWGRTLGQHDCADAMTRGVLTAEFGTPLAEAWRTMRERRIKALPVIDRARRVVGIVTMADFMRLAQLDGPPIGLGARLLELLRPIGRTHTDRLEVVGQIMTADVRVARAGERIVDLIPLFSEAGHHHIPIVDDERRLVGIITQTDLVRVLYASLKAPDRNA